MSAVTAIPAEQLEQYRRELTGYCYRMLGSVHEAEDAVQETMLRAWKALARFEDRAGLRPWLYRIATNVCLDMLKSRSRRALPMDVAPVGTSEGRLIDRRPEETWIGPAPDSLTLTFVGDPAEYAVSRESVRLAFIAALQDLAPRQRAVLILRDVLALACRGSRHAPRHESRRGQQRAPPGPFRARGHRPRLGTERALRRRP